MRVETGSGSRIRNAIHPTGLDDRDLSPTEPEGHHSMRFSLTGGPQRESGGGFGPWIAISRCVAATGVQILALVGGPWVSFIRSFRGVPVSHRGASRSCGGPVEVPAAGLRRGPLRGSHDVVVDGPRCQGFCTRGGVGVPQSPPRVFFTENVRL